jgi:exonuclease III
MGETAGLRRGLGGQKSWNGVAILARDCGPIVTSTELPGEPADKHRRYIEAAIGFKFPASREFSREFFEKRAFDDDSRI